MFILMKFLNVVKFNKIFLIEKKNKKIHILKIITVDYESYLKKKKKRGLKLDKLGRRSLTLKTISICAKDVFKIRLQRSWIHKGKTLTHWSFKAVRPFPAV